MPSSLEPSSSTPGKKPATATIAQSGTLNVFLSISNSTPWIIDSEDQANDIFTKAEYKGTSYIFIPSWALRISMLQLEEKC